MDEKKGDQSRQDVPRPDLSRHILSAEETSLLFAEAGVPRSVRSVQRYCKNGHLDCITVDTELNEKYLIEHNSVERRIKELQQLTAFTNAAGDASSRVQSRQDVPRPDLSRHDELQKTKEKITELKESNLQLTIDRAAKEQFINQLVTERKEFITQLTEQSRQIGVLETKLLQAPQPQQDKSQEGDNPVPEMTNGRVQ